MSNFLTQIESFFCCSGWVRSVISGSGNFPKEIPYFSIFLPLGLKNLIGRRVKKYPDQSWVCFLFSASQKFAQGPSFIFNGTKLNFWNKR